MSYPLRMALTRPFIVALSVTAYVLSTVIAANTLDFSSENFARQSDSRELSQRLPALMPIDAGIRVSKPSPAELPLAKPLFQEGSTLGALVSDVDNDETSEEEEYDFCILGTVVDSQKRALAGATIEVTQIDGVASFALNADDDGHFESCFYTDDEFYLIARWGELQSGARRFSPSQDQRPITLVILQADVLEKMQRWCEEYDPENFDAMETR